MSDASKPRETTAVPPRRSRKPGVGPGPAKPRRTPPARNRSAAARTRKRNRLLAIGAVIAVVVIVVVVVAVGLSSGGGGSSVARQPAPPAAVAKVENIPLSTLIAASARQPVDIGAKPAVGGPPPVPAGAPATTPVALYIGAEFCPYCAALRWPLVIALSKFGTFSNLSQTHSAVRDGNIGTWSFYGSTYTSRYITFDPLELYTNQPSGGYYKPLEANQLSQAQNALWQANTNAYVTNRQEGFPFFDFAGKFVLMNAPYPVTLVEGRSFSSILAEVGDNTSAVGLTINSSAASLIKNMCNALGGNAPSSVCQAPGMALVPA
jgi:hypothetical protein